MKILNLSLIFFKNHKELKWAIDADILGISGLNGAGKTNVLDAIYYLCTGKSYFAATDVQSIKDEEPVAGIISSIDNNKGAEVNEVKVKFKRGSRKSIEQNGVLYSKITQYLGTYYAVVIAPGDIALVYGANEVRRNFVNQVLSQTNKTYLDDLLKYNKLLDHRNKLLKQDQMDGGVLDAIDSQMAPIAERIYIERKSFLEKFIPIFQHKYLELAEEKEQVNLVYVSQLENANYLELVKNSRRKDIAVQRSFVGIHKDELDLQLNDFVLKKYGSQGQIKSTLIALKLAEYEYVSSILGFLPVLLLDDIFEKIDDNRAKVLTQLIKKGNFGQVFVTDTNADRVEQFCKAIDKRYQLLKL